jgi:hypothetical protein
MKTPSRTFLLAIAFVAAVSLNSCKKDKANGNENTEATLLASGTWKLSRIEYQKKSDGTWVDKPLEPGVEVTMSFKGDKTVVVVSPTESAVRRLGAVRRLVAADHCLIQRQGLHLHGA